MGSHWRNGVVRMHGPSSALIPRRVCAARSQPGSTQCPEPV